MPRSTCSARSQAVTYGAAWGDEEQKRAWLPRLTSGEAVGCFGLTEPGTGSDAANLATRAVRDDGGTSRSSGAESGGGYVLDGTKMFITNGTWADLVLLFARTGGAPGRQGIGAFLVPADSPGLERREIHGKLGLRGQATAELVLDGVRVPAAAMLGPEGRASRSRCLTRPYGAYAHGEAPDPRRALSACSAARYGVRSVRGGSLAGRGAGCAMGAAAERAKEENEEWAGVTPDAARRLVSAAVEAFAERGYHATTTRDIAGRAGMSPAALYIHYKTKEELLYRISGIGHEKALRIMGAAAEAGGSASERLRDAVRTFARWHAEHHTTARVIQYELQALSPGHYTEIAGLRRRTDRLLRQIIQDGADSGEFRADDVPGTTLAVLSLCVDVARWFTADGPRTPDEVGTLYADLVLRMVGAPTA